MRDGLALTLAVVVTAGVLPAAGGQTGSTAQTYTAADAPADVKPAIARAQRAFDEYHDRLIARMNEELGRGGPVTALSVYRDEAKLLTATIARRERMRIGRTSHHLRNPLNRPPEWAAPFVNEAEAAKRGSAPVRVVDLGGMVGVLAPVETKEVCTLCHGPADALPPAVQGAIRKDYPGDRAAGFQAGDVRGWMWAEVPKR